MNEQENNMKADAIFEFVNLMIGAFDSGFVDKNNPKLAEVYQVARNHVNDAYGIKTPGLVEQWGEETAISVGLKIIPAK